MKQAAALETYQRDGVARLGSVLARAEVERLRALLERFDGHDGPGSSAGNIVHDVWRQVPEVAEVVRSLAPLACGLLGVPECVLFQDHLVWKTPGSDRIEWHQDYSYQPLTAPLGVTLWLSLDAIEPETGCLHYVPGTHHLGERAPADFISGAGQPARPDLPPLDLEAYQEQVVAYPTQPGELLAHHPLVWHMSRKNSTDRQRRALSMNWLDPSVRWKPSQAPHPFNYALRPSDEDPLDPARFPTFSAR